MFNNFDPGDLIIFFVVFLFSLSLHEAAHAWVSERFGDNTGRYLGRITLNPLAHIDPIGTILFPLIGYFGGAMFGWAKPVPVNPLNWREKRMANIMTSMAGPASNFLLAIMAFGIVKVMIMSGFISIGMGQIYLKNPGTVAEFVVSLFLKFLQINIVLGVFNLIPVPPLDGSHVLEEFLPYEAAKAYEQIRPYGFILLIGLMYMGVFSAVINPVMSLVVRLLVS